MLSTVIRPNALDSEVDSSSLTDSSLTMSDSNSSLSSLEDEFCLDNSQTSSFIDDNIHMGDIGDKTVKSAMAVRWNNATYRAEVQAGNRIAFYKFGEDLGVGKFSKVRVGHHAISGDTVAVKIVEKTRISQKRQHVLQREIRMLQIACHPNIIRLFEFVDTLQRLYIIMELAPGVTLQKFLAKHSSLNEYEKRTIFQQIVSAVSHLHSNSIAHRDIKADNVVYDWIGRKAVLVDFGFACYSNSNYSTTFCGSPPYAAPELFLSQKYRAKAVDIWALGCLFYFIQSGTLPFNGQTIIELKNNIKRGEFTIPKGMSSSAERMLNGMLRGDFEKRFNIEKIKKSSWFAGVTFPNGAIELSQDRNHPDPKIRERVEEAESFLTQQYAVTEEELQLALAAGLSEPLTGLYRLTYFRMHCVEKPVPQPTLTKRAIQPLKHRSRLSRVCTIL